MDDDKTIHLSANGVFVPVEFADQLEQDHELLDRLEREVNKITNEILTRQVEALMGESMLQPIQGKGICNPDSDETARHFRKKFRVMKGGLEK